MDGAWKPWPKLSESMTTISCPRAMGARRTTVRKRLERNFVVFFDLSRRGRGRAALARTGIATAARTAVLVAFAVEHLHLIGDDFGAVALLSRLFVVPGIGADRTLDVDELPLAQILAADLRQFSPGDDVVPLGPFLLLASLVGVAVIGRERELRDAGAAGC